MNKRQQNESSYPKRSERPALAPGTEFSQDKDMTNQEKILRQWVRSPERWQRLWDTCQHGGGKYKRGLFVLDGKGQNQTRPKTRQQVIVELLKNEPMGYLS